MTQEIKNECVVFVSFNADDIRDAMDGLEDDFPILSCLTDLGITALLKQCARVDWSIFNSRGALEIGELEQFAATHKGA